MRKFTLTAIVLLTMIATAGAQETKAITDNGPEMIAPVNTQSLLPLTNTELASIDLSGKYTGTRYQFTPDKKAIMQTFEYEFDLTQTGDIISGTSTIIKANGDYADIKLRGMIVGDKLYFEEYQIVNQDKDPNMVWCYKSGALNIRKNSDNMLKLTGVTNSYMADYYIPCTGGTTDLTKVDNSNNFKSLEANGAVSPPDAANSMMVYPNPFMDATNINYTLAANSTVTLEVYDISGKRVAQLETNTAKSAGTYNVNFSAKNAGLAAGVFIAKLTVDGKVYSSEMVQMK